MCNGWQLCNLLLRFCFRLWAKHNGHSSGFLQAVLSVMFWLAETIWSDWQFWLAGTVWVIGSPEPSTVSIILLNPAHLSNIFAFDNDAGTMLATCRHLHHWCHNGHHHRDGNTKSLAMVWQRQSMVASTGRYHSTLPLLLGTEVDVTVQSHWWVKVTCSIPTYTTFSITFFFYVATCYWSEINWVINDSH